MFVRHGVGVELFKSEQIHFKEKKDRGGGCFGQIAQTAKHGCISVGRLLMNWRIRTLN